MKRSSGPDIILDAMEAFSSDGVLDVSSTQLIEKIDVSPATLKRHLYQLVKAGRLRKSGKARATRYRLPQAAATAKAQLSTPLTMAVATAAPKLTIPMSQSGSGLLSYLQQPLGTRPPVGYQKSFVDQYRPNETSLLPQDLADELYKQGRLSGQLPAGTYARKVLEHLLIDLSWSSSRLEGNRYSLLATEELFQSELEASDPDAVMLLNHKRAIEFLVDAVPEYGLSNALVCNLHSILMRDLLSDPRGLGEVRSKIVNISDTTYVPTHVKAVLQEMLNKILVSARHVKNPIESAFFLWVNVAYLQPFEDGNKRTSRLAANIPFMLYNCAPLSFTDTDPQDYAYAMMGIYERQDVSLAVDLFAWTYRRSIQKYGAVVQAMGAPDPFRLKCRRHLDASIQAIVGRGETLAHVLTTIDIAETDKEAFTKLLTEELAALTPNNCARYGITMKVVGRWIAGGRITQLG